MRRIHDLQYHISSLIKNLLSVKHLPSRLQIRQRIDWKFQPEELGPFAPLSASFNEVNTTMINASTALRSPLISRSVAGLIWRGLHHQRPQTTVRYRRLSNISNSEATSLPPPPASASTSAVAVDAVPTLVRHGPGDGVITLNVGGTEFLTLRSTVDINPVLRNYVIRAEANKEFTNGCAVFIDRDPTHFSLILQHLRNKADSVNVYSSMSKFSYLNKYGQVLVQIPKDKGELRDLFVEARHYKIKELEDVCDCQESDG